MENLGRNNLGSSGKLRTVSENREKPKEHLRNELKLATFEPIAIKVRADIYSKYCIQKKLRSNQDEIFNAAQIKPM